MHVHSFLRSAARAICGASLASALLTQVALSPTTARAQSCEFSLGFAALASAIGPGTVGACLEEIWYDEQGDARQRTTGGVFAWRAADNWTAFTDGFRTWINGPMGLTSRLNTERYSWEVDAGAPGTTLVGTDTTARALDAGAASPTPRPPVNIEFDWFSASVNGVSPHGHHATYVRPGDEVTVRLNATATRDAVFLIDVELYDHQYGRDAERVKLWQTFAPQFPFSANTPVTIEQRFVMPELPPGRYRVHLGIFTEDWQHMMAWNDYAGFIEVV